MKKIFFLPLLFFIYCCSAQTGVRVYIGDGLKKDSREAIIEMTDLLRKSAPVSFVLDSIGQFEGKGIYITTVSDDYYKKYPSSLRTMGEEGMFIKSDKGYLYIAANSTLALREAIFIYLEKLGFRFYFPDPLWHRIPALNSVFLKTEIITKPDFVYRFISMGWGEGDDNLRKQHNFWQRANCMGGSFYVNTGHAYNAMVLDNKSEFKKHPEYLSKPLLNDNLQSGTVYNYSSDGLVDLAHKWAAKTFDYYEFKGTPLPMWSMEPFDGNTFCDLPACKAIGGNSSDQVMYFTNKVARKLKQTHPGKKIGLLAYHDHIDIPKYNVEDNIFITLTNGFNNTNYTTGDLIDRWRKKVKELGIYDYMSVYSWDYDQPGKGLAANYRNVTAALKNYKVKGINVYIAESTYGWINKGLGHYIASKLLWSSRTDTTVLLKEFYNYMFPQTNTVIQRLFNDWMKYRSGQILEDNIYTWFTLLNEAFSKCTNNEEIKRLEQIAVYLNYVNLSKKMSTAMGDDRKQKANELFAYMWRFNNKGIIASHAGLNEITNNFGTDFSINNTAAGWKSAKAGVPAGKDQWMQFLSTAAKSFRKIEDVKPYYEWTKIAKPTPGLLSSKPNWDNSSAREFNIQFQGKIIVDLKNSDSLFLKVTAGRVAKKGNVTLAIYNWNDSLFLKGNALKTYSIPADGKENKIDLRKFAGKKYIITYADNGNAAKIYFPGRMKFSVIASAENPLTGGLYNTFYFYVPPGVSKFYIVKTGHLRISRPGKKVTDYGTEIDMAAVNVEKGEAGWWLGTLQLNNLYFVGIPPFISFTPQSIFLP